MFPATHSPPFRRWEESDLPANSFGGLNSSEDEFTEAFKDFDVWGEQEDDDESDDEVDLGEEENDGEEVFVFPTQFYAMDIPCA